ncbi:META domain-containing protein [Terrimonas rubra]|uniref:META domain-containing protein n=1 Tax=Terrimonas rubra TaxID=1035890 RepID=A0ABW6A533_9BACT
MRTYLSMLLAVLLVITSCATGKKAGGTAQPLTSTKWVLTSFTDNGKDNKVSNSRAFIKFDDSKQSVGGNGSCNNFGGSYTLDGNKLSVSKVFSTKMFCQDVQKTEDSFLRLLETATRYEIKGDHLTIYNAQGAILHFTAAV